MRPASHYTLSTDLDQTVVDEFNTGVLKNYIRPINKHRPRSGCKLVCACCLLVFMLAPSSSAWCLSLAELLEISTAYLTHLTIHELGHQLVADEVGVTNHKISFFTEKEGQFYLGLSTYDSIPRESRLPYAMGGERLVNISFEYNLEAYRRNPATFTKAMLFFDTVDFLGYTLFANYVNPDNLHYDPTLARHEIGMSKDVMLSLVLTKTLLNTWRIFHAETPWSPVFETDRDSVRFQLRYRF